MAKTSDSPSGLRRRKADKPAQTQSNKSNDVSILYLGHSAHLIPHRLPAPHPSPQDPPIEDKASTDVTSMLYMCHQYGGGILGLTSCIGTVATYQQHDSLLAAKLLAWMALGFIALLIHETRPFKRC